jgi:polyphosphate glucokinase
MNVLVVDVGGTHVKILVTGEKESREFVSGPKLTPRRMVTGVKQLARGWTYDVVSIGYPGSVLRDRPVADPHNLARVGFRRWKGARRRRASAPAKPRSR